MRSHNLKAKKWLMNRLKRKYKIPIKTTEEVLGAISDLKWDWRKSKFDLYGICIEEILQEWGEDRRPDGVED